MRAAIARVNVGHARADIQDLDPELMAGNARITKERHFAQVAADIGAANAYLVDADQCLARLRNRHRDVIEVEDLRSAMGVKSNAFHRSGDG